MLVEVSADLLGDPDGHGCCDAMLLMWTRRKHEWALSSPAGLDQLLSSSWYESGLTADRKKTVRALAEHGFQAQAAYGGPQTTIGLVGGDDGARQIESLFHPAVLVVENAESDSTFVRSILQAYDERALLEAIDKSWIVFRHSGGSGGVVDRMLAELRVVGYAERLAALLDSDSRWPGEVTVNHKKAQQLADEGMRVHVLAKREVENYIPNRALAVRVSCRDLIRWLKLLSHEQRSYYDMKKGFPAAAPVDEAYVSLWEDLDAGARTHLEEGLGDSVLGVLPIAIASLRPADFDGPDLNASAELLTLIELLKSMV
ncbi:MAG: hypothetical protein JWN46_1988 [Acidimicrobiales bacterium]|nr:hypothetical protein [Acidimicrobiales bacterium]